MTHCRRMPRSLLPSGLVLAAAIFAARGSLAAGPAETYLDAQLRVVQALEGRVDSIASAADEAAARLIKGGKIHLAGERGMVSELAGRAGGLCAAKPLALDRPLPQLDGDVVLFSDYGHDGKSAEGWNKLTQSGALVIAFASFENPLLHQPLPGNVRAIPVQVPRDSRLLALPGGERLLPAASPAIAIAQWAYTAELIGACRRQGKQLAVYLSIHLDEGQRRFQRTQGLLFEPDQHPEPVARGAYARRFLAEVRTSLEAIRRDELPKIRQAAGWLREAIAAQRQIVRNLMGHLPPVEAGIAGDVSFFTATTDSTGEPGAVWIRKNLHAGDVYVFVGYQQNEDAMAAAAKTVGARTVFMTSLAPGAEQAKNASHLYVNPHWPVTDGCLELSGYDVKACPLSCILGLSCYYAICGEAVAMKDK